MAAATVAHLYNTLPTLGHADGHFVDREPVFKQLAQLLSEYDDVFGVCLVRSRCELDDTEIVLARGNVSAPEQLANVERYYPERWLADGAPFEFATRRTDEPPRDLVTRFSRTTREFRLRDVLGFYHIDGGKDSPTIIEWTEGRKNLTGSSPRRTEPPSQYKPPGTLDAATPSPWLVPSRATMRTTRSGNSNTHKNTQTHN